MPIIVSARRLRGRAFAALHDGSAPARAKKNMIALESYARILLVGDIQLLRKYPRLSLPERLAVKSARLLSPSL